MSKLGISIYPEREHQNRWIEYLEMAAGHGFSRVFESLLQLDGLQREEIIKKYRPINEAARNLEFEIIVDVAPELFNKIGVTPFELSFFQQLAVDGFRLDVGYSGVEESIMTCNPFGLLVEINASIYSHYVDCILDYQPARSQLIACHNFYPQKNTGLSIEHYQKTCLKFKNLGLRLAAFVTSLAKDSFGPWPIVEGLPTLECHRDLPIECQVTHMLALGNIDDILISNCFPDEQEIKAARDAFGPVPMFDIILDRRTSVTERMILFEELHISRGDVSDRLIRSTWPRVKYAGNNISLFNATPTIHRGDVVVNSGQYDKYAGEMHIALSDYANTGKSNVVGKIRAEELLALDAIKPWQKFKLRLYQEE